MAGIRSICLLIFFLVVQVVDETDRLLREAYQAWLPTVLQLTSSTNKDLFSSESSRISMPRLLTIRRS
jgi:ATP-dependent RNA helicase DDX51/DBP6